MTSSAGKGRSELADGLVCILYIPMKRHIDSFFLSCSDPHNHPILRLPAAVALRSSATLGDTLQIARMLSY